jgi:hypothetical protein
VIFEEVRDASGEAHPGLRTLGYVSPRRNRPSRSSRAGSAGRGGAGDAEPIDGERTRRGVEGVQAWSDGEWMVRTIPGGAAGKAYRCPGCDQEIRPGMAHVVAWPADGRGDEGDRRHWHTGCWRARDRRTPTVQRSRNAPRYG